ncbi:MAG TPA: hypothetical protein VIY96_06045, partial [Thermoanaerobaculia bacterium]
EDLVACGEPGFELPASRERGAQTILGRWNDLRLFLERIDRERKEAEERGSVRLAAELEELSRALQDPLAAVRREATVVAGRLSTSLTSSSRSASA